MLRHFSLFLFLAYNKCILGKERVGKTALLTRFMTGEFVEADHPTLQATRTKKIVLPDSSICFAEVMDTGGEPQVYDSKHAKVSILFTDPSGSIGVKDFCCVM